MPILVTGAHRSGTTWVGRLLATAPRIAYISEPLNVLHRPGVFPLRVADWYTYVCRENEQAFLSAFQDLLSLRYDIGAELASLRSGRDLLRMGRDLATFVGGRLGHRLPLLKDPFAVFSLRWFAERLNCRLLVTVRHPAAFASGLKRLGWEFDFENLLRQPLLMRDHLEPYRAAMLSEDARDVVGQAGVLWSIVYGTLHKLQAWIPGVHVSRHEDLASSPVEEFRKLFAELGLDFTDRARRAVLRSSASGNPAELASNKVHSVRMDSRASLENWKHRLSKQEVARIRRLTENVASLYYGEASWR